MLVGSQSSAASSVREPVKPSWPSSFIAPIFNLVFPHRNSMMPTSTRREFLLATAGAAALGAVRPIWQLAQPVEGTIHFKQTQPLLELQQTLAYHCFDQSNHIILEYY